MLRKTTAERTGMTREKDQPYHNEGAEQGKGLLTLRLFGRFAASRGDKPLTALHVREGERLLAFLVMAHSELVEYRTLAERFWPAEALQNAEAGAGDFVTVRQAVRSLRVALGEEAGRLQSPVRSAVRLDLTGADVDWDRFARLAASGNSADWQAAVSLAERGPLLDGWQAPWVTAARLRARRQHEQLLRQLADHATQTGNASDAQNWLRRLLVLRPDDEQALQQLLAVSQPQTAPPASPIPPNNYVVRDSAADGGAVPIGSPFYIERPADDAAHAAVLRGDSIVLLKGPRQVGKTSLLARALQGARTAGNEEESGSCKDRDIGTIRRVLLTDFGALSEARLGSSEAFCSALAGTIAEQLDLDFSPRRDWDEEFDPSVNLERFLRRHVLQAEQGPVVWGIDEADRLLGVPFAAEIFALFRSWHNRRALDPSGPWSRLTLVIAYATEAHLLIADRNQSPFNVGTRIALSDLTPAEATALNARYGSPLSTNADQQRLYRLLGGHPFLTQGALAELAARHETLRSLEEQGERDTGPFSDHLRRLLQAVTAEPEMAEAFRVVLRGKGGPLTFDAFYRLRSAGLIVGDSIRDVQPRCHLYADFFTRHLGGE